MASVREVREALASVIEESCGITCIPRMTEQIVPPMAAIFFGSPPVRYGVTMGGVTQSNPLGKRVRVPTELRLSVVVFVARANGLEDAQAEIDKYLGFDADEDAATSIPLAIEENSALGGIVEYAEPLVVQSYGDIVVAGQQYFHASITVDVSMPGAS